MKKQTTLLDRLRRWDAASFDLTEAMPADRTPAPAAPGMAKAPAPVERVARRRTDRFFRAYPWLAVIGLGLLAGCLLLAVLGLPAFGAAQAPAHNEVMDRYIRSGLVETGAVNVVAGVILDYRAFDTLGESHVLFTAMAAVMILLLGTGETGQRSPLADDPVLRRTARVLGPVILLFGVYVILNGHLGPGGGFSGGAVIGGALILMAVGLGFAPVERVLNQKTVRLLILACLCLYSLAKCYSFYCGANRLETVFSPGTPGAIVSAGLILPLNIAVGIVVSCTMYGFYSIFKRGRL